MKKEALRLQMLSGIITESEYKTKLEESSMSLEESLWDRIKNVPKSWLAKIKGDFPAIIVKSLEDSGIKVGKPIYFYDRRYNDSNSTREGEWILSKSTLKSVNYNTGNNDFEVEVSRDGGKTWKLDDVESLRIKLDLESDLSKLQTMDEEQLQAWYEKTVAATKKQFDEKNVAYNPKDLKAPETMGESLNENEETEIIATSEKIADKIANDPKAQQAIDNLSDEEIEKLRSELNKLGITSGEMPVQSIEDKIDAKIVTEAINEADGDLKQKIAKTLDNIASLNISAWGGIPLAIAIGSMVGFAPGLAISWGATSILKGLAKILDKKLAESLNENKQKIKISKKELAKIISEEIVRFKKKSLLENRLREIDEELKNL